MKKKDLLLESFENKLKKTELNSVLGGQTGITQFAYPTAAIPEYHIPAQQDHRPDQE